MLAVSRAADLTAACATAAGCGSVAPYGAMGRGDGVFAGCRWLCRGCDTPTQTAWPKSRFSWWWGWLCSCGPVMWDETLMPDVGVVSPVDRGTLI